jgi:uncharacterized protein
LYDTFGPGKASEGQCDCACVASLPIDRQPATPLTNVSYSLNPGNPFLAVSLTANYYATLGRDSNSIVLNHSALVVANHFSQARPLQDIPLAWRKAWRDEDIQSTLEQMVTLNMLVPKGYVAPPLIEALTTLSAWLHVTDHCNLRCVYCYLPHARADMSAETGRAAIDATFRSALAHGYSQVKLKYAGGEPLLCFPLITQLHRHAQALSNQHDLALDGVLLSNGTLLTAQMVKTMQSLGLRLMISLDGLGEYHNRQRHFADGRGSFDAVARAINLALSHSLVPDISITISGRNADGLPELMAWVLERDLPFSLNFYRENDFSASQADLRLEEECIIEKMLAAYKVIEANLPRRSLLASLADRANLSAPHLRTCSVGHSYLVFNHLGQVAKCQMDIKHIVTDVNDPDPLTTVGESAIGVRNLKVDEKVECRDCQWRYWCAGGCPLMAYRATGRYDVKSPNCNIYKALYPEVLRLEGLRLLKYADEVSTHTSPRLQKFHATSILSTSRSSMIPSPARSR